MGGEHEIDHMDELQWAVIEQAITANNRQRAGDDASQTVCFVLQAPGEEIAGGIAGVAHWDWFSLDLIWVREELRGRGYGTRLLGLAEEEARERGARSARLDTFSFQAPGFYLRHGYELFGELQSYPSGHQRCYLVKQLSGASGPYGH